MVFLTIVTRLTEAVMTNELTFGLTLSRLGIAQASLALLSLLHRLSMPALSNVRFRARNRPPLSDFIRIIRKIRRQNKKVFSD